MQKIIRALERLKVVISAELQLCGSDQETYQQILDGALKMLDEMLARCRKMPGGRRKALDLELEVGGDMSVIAFVEAAMSVIFAERRIYTPDQHLHSALNAEWMILHELLGALKLARPQEETPFQAKLRLQDLGLWP